MTDNTLVLDLKKSNRIKFIYYTLFYFNLNRLVFGSGQPLITGGQLKALRLNIPHLEEQKKIDALLSAIDKKTEFINTQLEQTKIFKKGLLQQMFV